jgi:hypothetical protein
MLSFDPDFTPGSVTVTGRQLTGGTDYGFVIENWSMQICHWMTQAALVASTRGLVGAASRRFLGRL